LNGSDYQPELLQPPLLVPAESQVRAVPVDVLVIVKWLPDFDVAAIV
jgi:hypothetical protein